MEEFKENPLIKRKNLNLIDMPGTDNKIQGRDKEVHDSMPSSKNCPNIIIYLTTPPDVDKQSTYKVLNEFRKNQLKKMDIEKNLHVSLYEMSNNPHKERYTDEID